MNKTFKLSLVIVAVLAVVLFAQSGAWAGKLQGNDQAPSIAVNEAGARPAGTASGSNVKLVTHKGTAGISGIIHNKMGAANSGRPDGTYFKITGNETHAVTVKIEVGPGWNSTLSYYLAGAWHPLGFTRDGNTLTATLPAGAIYLAVSPMG